MKKWTYANESQNAYVRFLNLLSANRNQTSTYREVRTKIKREYWNKYPKWENLHRVLLLFSVKYVVIEMLKRRKNGFFCCLRPHGRSGLKLLSVSFANRRIKWFANRLAVNPLAYRNLYLVEPPMIGGFFFGPAHNITLFFKRPASGRNKPCVSARLILYEFNDFIL